MTTELVLVKYINPLNQQPTQNGFIFILTNDIGETDINPEDVTYFWIPQNPNEGYILCNYILSKLINKAMIYSEHQGFILFDNNGVKENYIGFNGLWSRIPIKYFKSNMEYIREGDYIVDFE